MKVLKVNKTLFICLGICPIDDETNHHKQLYKLLGWLAVLTTGSIIVSCVLSSIDYGLNDLYNSLYAAYPGVATSRVFIALILMIFYPENITLIFENLQTFYDQSGSAESRVFFENANEVSEKVFKALTIYFPSTFIIQIIFGASISVVYCYVTKGYVHTDYLYVPFKFALPWNEHNIIGWMGTITYSVTAVSIYFAINSMMVSFFVSISLYFKAFYNHFAVMVEQIDKPLSEIENMGHSQRMKQIHAKQILREVIEFHIFEKELFSIAAKIFNVSIFYLIFSSVGLASISIFLAEMAIQKMELSSIVYLISCVISAFTDAFVFCYFGAKTTKRFSKYIDRLYDVYWYDLPAPLQKPLIMIIANLQRPLEYRGFGMVTLNLATFINIVKAVFSYYLAFRAVN